MLDLYDVGICAVAGDAVNMAAKVSAVNGCAKGDCVSANHYLLSKNGRTYTSV